LDEFEKAHPDILNLFLSVLDDGRLTDRLGRVVNFENTIIIATSNAHSDLINESLNQGETMDDIAGYLKKRLTDVFKPELLNRFSEIVIFKSLTPLDLEAIVKLRLGDLVQRLKESQNVELKFDSSAVSALVRLGYDPAFGARPLRGVISEKIEGELATKILKEEIRRGETIDLKFEKEAFVFTAE
ncbi:MAG TPA: AAA family ATPase, partial [Candidatus Tyrphobacter sp.]|nr:AAA family ATPase [Candidatus Tyrphobacter sp.]